MSRELKRSSHVTANRRRQRENLEDEATHILEESRMVLPGLQALIGFQFIAVFHPRFVEALTFGEQVIHLVSIGFVAVAVALLMAPAAYHRQVEPDAISQRFLRLAGQLLTWGMFFLLLGINVDFYLIARLILQDRVLSLGLTAVLSFCFGFWWFLFPLWEKPRP